MEGSESAPVREGDILAGKYRVERVLGVGGMGVVVAAMHTELEERVALKFLLPGAAQNPAVVARFNREARAVVKIKSQHVARVRDVGTLETGTPYIVMEYLEGKDLGDIITARGPLPIGTAVDYVLQAAEAVAEAHAAGIVHRDLKPPNLFLATQSDGTVMIKVLDFGISKAAIGDDGPAHRGNLTGTQEVFGSPTYMSPEQLKASRDVDARADVWALGVILYELMSGKAPFDRPTVAETFGAILYEEAAPLRMVRPEVPEELERVVLRCLEKDLPKRTPNVGELAKALLPYAASGSRANVERTSRILRRAGITIESVPPGPVGGAPSSMPSIPAMTALPSFPSSAGSQTRSAWDTASLTSAPSRSRSGIVIAGALGALVVGAGALFGIHWIQTRVVVATRPGPALTVVPDRDLSMGARQTPPGSSVSAGVSAGSPGAMENQVGAPPNPPASSSAPVVTLATSGSAAPAPSALTGVAGVTGKGRFGSRRRSPTGNGAPEPPAAAGDPPRVVEPPPAATPKPSKAPDDDFGDRK